MSKISNSFGCSCSCNCFSLSQKVLVSYHSGKVANGLGKLLLSRNLSGQVKLTWKSDKIVTQTKNSTVNITDCLLLTQIKDEIHLILYISIS